jgi:peptide/nickel transport system substrate-binding protein
VNRDTELRDLLDRADTTIDPVARNEAYAKAFRLIAERAYVLPLHSMPNYYVANKDLVFAPHTDTILRFYEMSWK